MFLYFKFHSSNLIVVIMITVRKNSLLKTPSKPTALYPQTLFVISP